jgi:hypothetical protein
MRHVHQRSGNHEYGQTDLQAEHIQDVAADVLCHDGALKGSHDPGVLLRGDVQLLEHGRSGYRERAARQVVDDGAEHNEADHPPSESSDFEHVVFLRELNSARR